MDTMSKQPTDEEVHKKAKEIYELDKTPLAPDWEDCSYMYARMYLNEAADLLGWKPKEKEQVSGDDV